jgi:hypothetical protein
MKHLFVPPSLRLHSLSLHTSFAFPGSPFFVAERRLNLGRRVNAG